MERLSLRSSLDGNRGQRHTAPSHLASLAAFDLGIRTEVLSVRGILRAKPNTKFKTTSVSRCFIVVVPSSMSVVCCKSYAQSTSDGNPRKTTVAQLRISYRGGATAPATLRMTSPTGALRFAPPAKSLPLRSGATGKWSGTWTDSALCAIILIKPSRIGRLRLRYSWLGNFVALHQEVVLPCGTEWRLS